MAQNWNQELILRLGLQHLPEKRQEEVLLQIGQSIFEGVFLRAMEELGEEDKNELQRLLGQKQDNQDEVFDFLRSKIPNLEEITKEEVEKFRSETESFLSAVGA